MYAPVMSLPEHLIRPLGPLAIVSTIAQLAREARESISATCYINTLTLRTQHPLLREMYRAILDAPSRGALCMAIMPDMLRHTPTPYLNARSIAEMREAGWTVRHPRDGNLLHAKTWLFDHRHSIIGSHNLTEQALLRNHDLSILIDCPRFAERLYRVHHSIPTKNADAPELQYRAGA